MSIKNLVEMIKRNGLLASMPQLEELYQVAIENELKLAESQRELRAADATIENLQMQVEKLAAENAGLKVTLEEIEVINRGGQAYCVKDGMSVNPIYARGWNDYRAKALSVETPATDDFLAEVRAQARNEIIDELEARFTELSKSSPTSELRSGAAGAAAFISTFRKGVQS